MIIVVNGGLFGIGHVMFGNWIAVAGTMATGMLFAYRYDRTRSLAAVWLEHTLWGWLVFTVGLGGYFFTGVSNLPVGRLGP
jgi:membrane protease YdiL (CAAX protease family)